MMRRTALVALLVLLMAMASPTFAESTPSDVAADFNNDGFADLAVGVPGENGFAGAVNVLYGSAAGLSGNGTQLFTQVGGAVESGDGFGHGGSSEDGAGGAGGEMLIAGRADSGVPMMSDSEVPSVMLVIVRGLPHSPAAAFPLV